MLSPIEKVIVATVITVIDTAIFALSPLLGAMAVIITVPLTISVLLR